MARTVNRYWCVPGTKSRNTAESTGRLPPTPTPSTASKEANVRKLDEPPAASPNIPAMRSVTLKDQRRPHMSHPKLQNAAPTNSPTFMARERNGPWKSNSLMTGLKIRPPMSCTQVSSQSRTRELLSSLTGHTLSLKITDSMSTNAPSPTTNNLRKPSEPGNDEQIPLRCNSYYSD